MPELLHDLDALRDIARSAPGPARSWAAGLLHVWAPGGDTPWPDAGGLADPTPVALRDWRLPGLSIDGPIGVELASILRSGLRYGSDVAPLLDDVEAHFAASPPAARVDLAVLLALSGRSSAERLSAVAPHTPRADLALLALAHTWATGGDLAVAEQVLGPLELNERSAVLSWIGLPRFLELRQPLELAAIDGALRAGGTEPSPPRRPGAKRHRVRAWVDQLLDGHDSLLAFAIRGAARVDNPGNLGTILVGSAAWLAAFQPSDDPVEDVLARNAACRPEILRAARSAEPLAAEDVEAALSGHDADCLLLLLDDPPRATLKSMVERGRALASGAFVPADPDSLPDLVLDPDTRSTALRAAAWCPTLPVLETLLKLSVPHRADDREALCIALIRMGDSVAARHAEAVLATDDRIDPAPFRALSAALGT